jgi:S-adenosylmethionine:tRNA ribosyltransferase-isomerase
MSPVAELAAPRTRFALPPGAEADGPPERRGVPRDGVRLLVARPAGIAEGRFRDLPAFLEPGDVLVVNTSATLPAALDARRADGAPVPLHVSTWLDDGRWVVEPRRRDGTGPDLGLGAGDELALPGGVTLRLGEAHPDPGAVVSRLWRAEATPPVPVREHLARFGRPIGYGYLAGRFPLADHQTVYATQPGSAEMPSAGRPFTAPLLVRLMAAGVVVAPIVLHAGVSSPELHEPPGAERFVVPEATARLVDGALDAGSRVVAVGTTVVRALESATGPDGVVRAAAGWTDLVLGPEAPARTVGGLVTGLHAPEASHLLLLEALAGAELVGEAYRAAVAGGYLWHEFGDSMLFLP